MLTNKTVKIYNCPYKGCKNKAIPTKNERFKDKSFFETRIINKGWTMGLARNDEWKLFCPTCSKQHLI